MGAGDVVVLMIKDYTGCRDYKRCLPRPVAPVHAQIMKGTLRDLVMTRRGKASDDVAPAARLLVCQSRHLAGSRCGFVRVLRLSLGTRPSVPPTCCDWEPEGHWPIMWGLTRRAAAGASGLWPRPHQAGP